MPAQREERESRVAEPRGRGRCRGRDAASGERAQPREVLGQAQGSV